MTPRTVRALAACLVATSLAPAVPDRAAADVVTPLWTEVDAGVGVAGNLNTSRVAVVDGRDRHVHLLEPPSTAVIDLGAVAVDPAGKPVRPRRLAVSGDAVFALLPDGVHRWRGGTAWQRVGGPAASIHAARAGRIVAGVFEPYLYAVDVDGTVRRNEGAPGQWTTLPGRAAEITEVGVEPGPDQTSGDPAVPGPARLYRLAADRGSISAWTEGTGWVDVGGPAAHLTGGPFHLLATDPVTGLPRQYDPRSPGWASLALPAAGPVPRFDVHGTFRYGWAARTGATLYYLPQPGRGEPLWGVRQPAVTPPGAAPVSRWYRLYRGATVQLTPRRPGATAPGDLVTLAGDGALTLFTWPEIGAGAPFGGHAVAGRPYRESRAVFETWTGGLTVAVTARGGLPPGVRVDLDPQGLVRLSGTPAAPGSYRFDLVAVDDSGAAQVVVGNVVTVHDPAAVPGTAPPRPINAWSAVTLRNCLPGGWSMPVFVRDHTAGTGWLPAAGSPVPPQRRTDPVTGAVSCPETAESARIGGPPGHLLDVVAVDSARSHCSFADDPELFGCVAARYRFTVDPAQPADHYAVASPTRP